MLKTIPVSINKRLSTISSTKEEFDRSKESYQKALDASDHSHTLTFIEPTQQKRKRKNRPRNILWFNPPYNASVTTNIGACFLQLLDKHFPKNNPLHKILNRNTVKVSYSCTKNIKSIMQAHNTKLLRRRNNRKPASARGAERRSAH